MCGVTHKQIVKSQPVPIIKRVEVAAIVPTAPPTPKFAARVDEAHMPTAEEKSADDYCPVGSKRKISFAPMVQIVLIPCLQEYREARILPSMFWSGDDLKAFRMDVLFSLQRYLPNVPSEQEDAAVEIATK